MLNVFSRLRLREWLMIFVSIGFIVAQVWLDLRVPDYMSEVTRLVSTPGSAIGDVLVQGGNMLLCTLGSVMTAVIVGFFGAKVGARLSTGFGATCSAGSRRFRWKRWALFRRRASLRERRMI